MTFAEEFNPEEGQDFAAEGGDYPTAFGITFTPRITGMVLALLGVFGAIYIVINFVKPAYDAYQTLKADEAAKQEQVDRQKSGELDRVLLDKELQLKQSEALKSQVLALFSTPNDLQTLLLDINGFVKSRNLKLLSFKPQGDLTVVTDSSLGEAVNNRLKRQQYTLEVEGNYQQTQALLRDLERLQPLLLVRGLKAEKDEQAFAIRLVEVKTNKNELVATGEAVAQGKELIKTAFTLEAIIPLTSEEIAALAPPPAEQPPPEQPK